MANEMKSFKEYLSGKRLRLIRLSVVAIILGILMLAPLAAAAKNPNPGVLPVDSHPYGMTYGQWSEEWWKWALSIPASSNPVTDTTGEFCAEGQSGKVWFLAGTFGTSETRDCSIPAGKALFFPIINAESSEIEGWGTTEELLREDATATADAITFIEVIVDGKTLQTELQTEPNLGYRVQSGLFTIWLPPDNVLGITTEEGVSSIAVADGYWIMLAPLSAGKHTIHIHGEVGEFFATEVTYELTVVPGGPTK